MFRTTPLGREESSSVSRKDSRGTIVLVLKLHGVYERNTHIRTLFWLEFETQSTMSQPRTSLRHHLSRC